MKSLRSSKRKYLLPIFLLGVLIYAIFLLTQLTFLNVRKVEINGYGIDDETDFSKLKEFIYGKKLYQLKGQDFENFTKYNFPEYEIVEIKKVFPNKLNLTLNKKESKHTVTNDTATYAIAVDYYVIGKVTEVFRPNIKTDSNLQIGEILPEPLKTAVSISNNGVDTYFLNGDLFVMSENGLKLVLPLEIPANRIPYYHSLINRLIAKYEPQNAQIDFVDLRFSKPVIKYK